MRFRRLSRFYVTVALGMALVLGLLLGGTMLLSYWHATRDLNDIVFETGDGANIWPSHEDAIILGQNIATHFLALDADSQDTAATLRGIMATSTSQRIALLDASGSELASTGPRLGEARLPALGRAPSSADAQHFVSVALPVDRPGGRQGWLLLDFQKHTDLGTGSASSWPERSRKGCTPGS